MKIEDYAVLGDTQSIALVGRDGSIDWACLPRFDSGALFAALLGRPEHGRWKIAPAHGSRRTTVRYRPDTLVLETEFRTADGAARVTDAMPIRSKYPDIVRVVEGLEGRVPMVSDLCIRFDYGRTPPRTTPVEGGLQAVAGPDAVVLRTPMRLRDGDGRVRSEWTLRAGQRVPFVLTWHPSHEALPRAVDPERAIDATSEFWRAWAARCVYRGPYRDAVVRSLLTLKALTSAPTGAIVAAGTTSLPEVLGGERNWDYRYAWLRDATFTLYAFLQAGYHLEARAWRDWLLRAVAGNPDDLQTMYGVGGEPHLEERTIDWLPGYEGSRPVRVGNAAAGQLQLDIYGEVLDVFHQARRMGFTPNAATWDMQRQLADWIAKGWRLPDEGFWEIRSKPKHHTHSKVMAWVAMDRAVKAVEEHGMKGPAARWRRQRRAIHDDVCAHGYDARLGHFTQSYGSTDLDATSLLMPTMGFLPPKDPRVLRTIDAVLGSLLDHGFVKRYLTRPGKNPDGLRGHEGVFLACTLWLVDALALAGLQGPAHDLFERVLSVRTELGLLSEEYDPVHERLVGNFPQAFSHVALVNSAFTLVGDEGPARHRART